jgi:Fic family protein
MGEAETNIHVLDAAYKPFPSFEEWMSHTTVSTIRWNRYRIALEKREKISANALKRAREIVKRAAALDTGAIEGLYQADRGFTYTVAFETTSWEVALAKKGEHVRSLFEAQMHAYDYVLDLATKSEYISEAAIRVLHEVVCKAQETYRVETAVGPQEQKLTKGRYKVLPNHVRTRDGLDHSYAPVDVTPAEMARMVEEFRCSAFLNAHPVIQASYAHYSIVVIHPFADGNGRLARALASTFTYRAISMPIMILSENKDDYLDALEDADNGQYQRFVDFMLDRSLDTMILVDESLRAALVPAPEVGTEAIRGLYRTKGGYCQEEVDSAGMQLIHLFQDELKKLFSANMDCNLKGSMGTARSTNSKSDSFHRLPGGTEKGLLLKLESADPAKATIERSYTLWLPVSKFNDDDIQIVSPYKKILNNNYHVVQEDFDVSFTARVDELIPHISGVLQIRMGLFAERVLGEMLQELKERAEQSIRRKT